MGGGLHFLVGGGASALMIEGGRVKKNHGIGGTPYTLPPIMGNPAVSLLSVISKVVEKRINKRIVDHLEKCGLFSDF